MVRFLNKDTGKFLLSSAPSNPKPFDLHDTKYRFTWSKNGHYFRSLTMMQRTVKRLDAMNINYSIIRYDENLIGGSAVIYNGKT